MKYTITRTDGKDITGNTYLVVNTDEPYAGIVADLIEQGEKKKGTWDHGQATLRQVMGIKEDEPKTETVKPPKEKRLAVESGVCPYPNQCQERKTCTKSYCSYDTCSNGWCYRFS